MRSPKEQEDFLTRGRFDRNTGPSLSLRLQFAFIGLFAGDMALLIVLLPGFSRAMSLLFFYGIFSFLGWAMVGLPVALGVAPHVLCRLTWPQRLLMGVALGPMALLIIFVILAVRGGTLKTFSLANYGLFWPMSMLVSATSFVVYTALLRRQVVLR